MTRQDWLLLMLAAAGRKPLSPLQLQKSLFLVGYDLAKLVGPDFYTFRPFDYGPFDATVYRDAEEQAAQGLVTIRSHPVTRRVFSLTMRGMTRARALEPGLPTEAARHCRYIVQWAQSQTFQELTQAIYEHFPAYAERSVLPGARTTARAAKRRPRERRGRWSAALTGAARLLDFGTTLHTRPAARRHRAVRPRGRRLSDEAARPRGQRPSDGAALRSDWDAIGGDLRAALSSFEAAEPATHEGHVGS